MSSTNNLATIINARHDGMCNHLVAISDLVTRLQDHLSAITPAIAMTDARTKDTLGELVAGFTHLSTNMIAGFTEMERRFISLSFQVDRLSRLLQHAQPLDDSRPDSADARPGSADAHPDPVSDVAGPVAHGIIVEPAGPEASSDPYIVEEPEEHEAVFEGESEVEAFEEPSLIAEAEEEGASGSSTAIVRDDVVAPDIVESPSMEGATPLPDMLAPPTVAPPISKRRRNARH